MVKRMKWLKEDSSERLVTASVVPMPVASVGFALASVLK